MASLTRAELKELLEDRYHHYSSSDFIEKDPIQIPHSFSLKQDIEISGFFAASLAWGQRVTIINKCRELFNLMDNAPYQFILNHNDKDLERLLKFKHRTFNDVDLLYFISFLKKWYQDNDSLEQAFSSKINTSKDVGPGLIGFHRLFFSLDHFPERTKKHVATPERKSACKRLNMFLRWMVRKDSYKIDFGIWNEIKPAQLICPFDVHVGNVSRQLKLVKRKQNDWLSALELTENLRKMDKEDPIKYDLALFSMGIDA